MKRRVVVDDSDSSEGGCNQAAATPATPKKRARQAVIESSDEASDKDSPAREIFPPSAASNAALRTRDGSSRSRAVTSATDIEECLPSLRMHSVARHQISGQRAVRIRSQLLAWYKKEKRALPWRWDAIKHLPENQRAYYVWVSEIMCQQTQVATVVPYWQRWVTRWPDVAALAAATQEQVNELWAGLGYYRRAGYLLRGAKDVVERFQGVIPRTAVELQTVPGIGAYTAGAIASIAFQQVEAAVDGNVIRVQSRLTRLAAPPSSRAAVAFHWRLARQLVDATEPGDYNQSVMELGATVCTRDAPACGTCPIKNECSAHKQAKAAASSFFAARGSDASAGTAEDEQQVARCDICEGEEDGSNTKVTQYPLTAKKTAQRAETVGVLVLCVYDEAADRSLFMLERRPASGLLAGMYQLPAAVVTRDQDAHAAMTAAAVAREPALQVNKLIPSRCMQRVRRPSRKKAKASTPAYRVRRGERVDVAEITHLFSHIRQRMLVHAVYLGTAAQLAQAGVDVAAAPAARDADWCWASLAEIETMAVSTGPRKALSAALDACEFPGVALRASNGGR